ncbi:hypothetical protein [uncultured Desulfuromusa sp.]|uniref:hypothetical protein n=1 Tax=uncultured Desulfuromusa sp. TaxID=219183 RepID=UPI002AA7E3AB|nr:hypothetical protein [uncultured Desulfuromusa sp.]
MKSSSREMVSTLSVGFLAHICPFRKLYGLFCIVVLVVFPLLTAATIYASPVEEHHYLKKTGDKVIDFDWHLRSGEDLELTTTLGEERDVTRMRTDFSTHTWSVDDPATETAIDVVRKGNTIIFKGIFKGKEYHQTVAIDSAPWYQALSLSLRQFVDADRQHLEFWSIRPDTLDIHRLQVNRVAEEELEFAGIDQKLIKLKIQLTGLKAHFWSCYYWLRESDGVFLRYEGPSGPPGWPMTTVELIVPPRQARVGDEQIMGQ